MKANYNLFKIEKEFQQKLGKLEELKNLNFNSYCEIIKAADDSIGLAYQLGIEEALKEIKELGEYSNFIEKYPNESKDFWRGFNSTLDIIRYCQKITTNLNQGDEDNEIHN